MADDLLKTSRKTHDEAGDGVVGKGPFDQDAHATPFVLWLSVLLMCVGAILLGVAVTALSWGTHKDCYVLIAVGVGVGLVGAVIGLVNNILDNVH